MRRFDPETPLLIGGVALIIVGIWRLSTEAGMIVGGALLLGVLAYRRLGRKAS